MMMMIVVMIMFIMLLMMIVIKSHDDVVDNDFTGTWRWISNCMRSVSERIMIN